MTRQNFDASAKAWAKIHAGPQKRRDLQPDQNFIRTLYYSSFEDWQSGEGKKVLDIGCGKGILLAYLGGLGYELYGTEVSSEALTKAEECLKENGLKGNFKIAEENLQYPDHYFDLIVCWGTLHFLGSAKHFDKMMTEIHRTLKPGHFLIGSMIRPDNTQILCSEEIAPNVFEVGSRWTFDQRVGSRIYCIPEKEKLKRAVEKYFTDVEIGSFGSEPPQGWGNWHYSFCARKPSKNLKSSGSS